MKLEWNSNEIQSLIVSLLTRPIKQTHAQIQKKKHNEKVWNKIKVNSKDTRMTLMRLFGVFFVNFEHIPHIY